MVNINSAPGFDGAEVFHPRWTNHPRFLAISGPYNQGGANQVRSGGKQAEVYLGRFSADFSRVEAWARVTNNSGGDSHPDVWIDARRSPHPRRPRGRIGPPTPRRAAQRAASPASADAGRVVVNVRLTRPGPIPTPQAILPYRHALVVNEYESWTSSRAHTRSSEIRDRPVGDPRRHACSPSARKTAGAAFTLTVERYDAHSGARRRAAHLRQRAVAACRCYYDVEPAVTP